MKKFFKKLTRYVPIWSLILFVIFLGALLLNTLYPSVPVLANVIHHSIGTGIRTVLATLTNWIPFSFAESLLILSPLLVGLICFGLARRMKRSLADGIRYFTGFLSLLSLQYFVVL